MAVPTTTPQLGVDSEVGTLRSVIVHRPDLAHERLSPTNCHDLLFDDVIWVRRAQQEFDAFVEAMRDRGVEVLLFYRLLAETLAKSALLSGPGSAEAWLPYGGVIVDADGPARVVEPLTRVLPEVWAA